MSVAVMSHAPVFLPLLAMAVVEVVFLRLGHLSGPTACSGRMIIEKGTFS